MNCFKTKSRIILDRIDYWEDKMCNLFMSRHSPTVGLMEEADRIQRCIDRMWNIYKKYR